jgi:hypothetical protein
VQIGAADAAGAHAKKHLAGSKFGLRYVGDAKRILSDGFRRGEYGGFHANLCGEIVTNSMAERMTPV